MYSLYKITDASKVEAAEKIVRPLVGSGRIEKIETDSIGQIIFTITSTDVLDSIVNNLKDKAKKCIAGWSIAIDFSFEHKYLSVTFNSVMESSSIVIRIANASGNTKILI